MEYNKFEKHLKETFLSKEESVDVSKIMSAVVASEKKSRKALYLSLALISILSVSSIAYFFNSTDSHLNSTEVIEESENLLAIDFKADNQREKIVELNSKPEKERAHTIQLDNSIDESSDINKGNNSDSYSQAYNESSSQRPLLNAASNNIVSDNNVTNNTLISDLQSTQSIYSINNKNVENKTSSSLNLGESSNKINFVNSTSKFTPLEVSYLSARQAEKLTQNDAFENWTLPKLVECPNFNRNPWIYEIGTIMGVSNPVKRFSINPNEINPALTSRAENEKSLEGLDLEFYLSAKRTRWPVFLKSGLAYSRWTEQMNLERNYTEIDTVQGIVSVTVSQTGDTLTYIYGDIFIEKDVEIKRKIHYYINRVSIPISMVYEKEFGKNNAFQAELGASFNISTFSAGSLYNAEDTFTNVDVGEFFRTITGVSYFTKLHYRRYINNHAFIGTLGHFHYLPAEFSSQSSFSQKYINYGLSVYAGYRF